MKEGAKRRVLIEWFSENARCCHACMQAPPKLCTVQYDQIVFWCNTHTRNVTFRCLVDFRMLFSLPEYQILPSESATDPTLKPNSIVQESLSTFS